MRADTLPSSSYAVLDSGYKYMYDRYNDVYRYIPLNGDIAGLCARTDDVADVFFSPEQVSIEEQSEVQLNYHSIQISHKETTYTLRELTQ